MASKGKMSLLSKSYSKSLEKAEHIKSKNKMKANEEESSESENEDKR